MAEGTGEEAVGATGSTVFISYASQDVAVANAVVGALERAGLACWIAPRDVVPGALYADEIVQAINACSVVVLVLSAQSVVSPHVGKELERASSKRRRIIALRTDAAALPRAFEYFLSESQWIEIGTGGIEPATAKLAEAVRRHLGSGSAWEPRVVPAARTPHVRAAKWRWRAMPIGVTAIAVLALLLIAGGVQWTLTSGGVKAVATPTTQDNQAEDSLAVLPFADMSPGHDQEYFSDGLSEELLNQLAHLPNLRVIGRTSSFSFKGKNEDLRKIGQVLGVNHILEGSVRKAGNRVRITAQLINPENGSHLWSETYDRTVQDVFGIQQDIASTVANALKLTLDTHKSGENGTQNVEAFDEFLAGRADAMKTTEKSLQSAAAHFERAVKLDPQYEMAWANLVDTYQGVIINVPTARAETQRKLDAAIDQVNARRPGSPLASYASYFRNSSTSNLVERHRLLESATKAPPPLGASAQLNNGVHLMAVGSNRKALTQLLVSRQVDPLAFFPALVFEISLEISEDYDRADADMKRLLESLGGDNAVLRGTALVRAMARRDEARIRHAAEAVVATDDARTPINASMLASLADRKMAINGLRAFLGEPRYRADLYALAAISQWAAYFGDPVLSLQALEIASTNDQVPIDTWGFAFWRPVMRDVRRLPGFKRLVKDRGLVDLWRATGDWGDFCKPVGKDDFECH